MEHLTRTRSLLGKRLFRRLWAGQFSASIVVYALSLAGVVLVEEQTHSSAQTGLAILSSILPAFLGSLVAGVVVDRFGRGRVLRASHLSRAVVALAFWAGTRLLPPGWVLVAVYGTNVTMALLTQFAAPAEMALLPELAGGEHLVAANTLFQFSLLIAEGVGIVALGPLVIKFLGVPAMGLLGALLYGLALAMVVVLPRASATEVAEGQELGLGSFWSDLKVGWSTIVRDRLLVLVTVQLTLASVLLLVLLSLLPGLISRHLGLGVEDAPFLILPGGVGFVLGSVLVNRWERRLSRPAWIGLGLTGVGACTALLALLVGWAGGGQLLLFVGLILVLGVALALVILPARAVLQERPPAAARGRVISAQLALGNAAAGVPLLMGGALADRLGIGPVMGALGLLALAAGAAGVHQARS